MESVFTRMARMESNDEDETSNNVGPAILSLIAVENDVHDVDSDDNDDDVNELTKNAVECACCGEKRSKMADRTKIGDSAEMTKKRRILFGAPKLTRYHSQKWLNFCPDSGGQKLHRVPNGSIRGGGSVAVRQPDPSLALTRVAAASCRLGSSLCFNGGRAYRSKAFFGERRRCRSAGPELSRQG